MRYVAIFIFATMIMPNPYCHAAGIALDGSVGNAGKLALPGPDYQIKAEYGRQSGANLFHGFQRFDIGKGESATFSGPDSVNNIIGRITGGSASLIDGKIASTIPNADLYLLNPAGFMFGPDASLDLSGSFHVSTADYLKMGETERFYAIPHENEVLSVAAPVSFGFLSSTPAKISLNGTSLEVSEGKAISIIGGDIDIRRGQLKASSGQITLGETGNIGLSDKTLISVSGSGGGEVNIRAGRFVTDDSIVEADNLSDKDAGKGVVISANEMEIANGGKISANAYGSGQSGNVSIRVRDKLSISGENTSKEPSTIQNAGVNGKGGMIEINAGQLNMEKGAIMNSGTYCDAPAGNIAIRLDDTLTISGESSSGEVSKISSGTYARGKGGNIELTAKQISLADGGQISSASYDTGDGGNIRIPRSDSVHILGSDVSGKIASGIYTDTQSIVNTSGKGGEIELKTKRLDIDNGGQITATTFGQGQGGNIRILADDSVTIRGKGTNFPSAILSNTEGKIPNAGNGGVIELSAKTTSLTDYGAISASSFGPGKGGDIFINSKQTVVSDKGQITAASQALGGGNAGNPNIVTDDLLIRNGYVVTETQSADGGNISMTVSGDIHLIGGKITTSVRSEAGNGGNITIENPNFFTLNHGKIIADAHGGRGGNILIRAGNFIESSASVISASSGLGIAYDGTIEINSSDPNLSSSLTILPGNFLDISRWASTVCDEQSQERISRLFIRRYLVRPEP